MLMFNPWEGLSIALSLFLAYKEQKSIPEIRKKILKTGIKSDIETPITTYVNTHDVYLGHLHCQ